MGFKWTIYDDLQRYYQHVISTTEDLNQPSGTVYVTAVLGSSRRIDISLTGLHDAKSAIASSGILTNFDATENGSSYATTISNPGITYGNTITTGYIELTNSAKSKTLNIIGTFIDEYGFSNDNIQTRTGFAIGSPTGVISSTASYVSSPRYFEINISSLSNAFGNTLTSSNAYSHFSGFTASNDGTSVTVVQPMLSGATVTAGKFQANDVTTPTIYSISGTFTDDYGFYTTITGSITVPMPAFASHNIEWNQRNYLRQFRLNNVTDHSVSRYAWNLSGTGTGSISSGHISSIVTLSTNVSSSKTLACFNMIQTNNEGFTKTDGTANSLDLNNYYFANETFSTYTVSHSNGLTFILSETSPPVTTSIDGESNLNRIVSRVWGNSETTNGPVTLPDDYLISTSNNNVRLGCTVNTQNIVGFVKTRVAADVQVSGSFTAFDSSGHRLSFTDLTTPSFSVRIDSIAYTASTNAKFRLIYYGSNNSSNIGISGNNYTNYEYIKMFARSVCDRGFQNNNETYLATFYASSNLPAPPPAPTVSLVGSLHNKTTNSVTFSNITSNAAHVNSHGIPNRTGITIGIKRSLDSNSNYSNLTNQVFGSNVTVTGLTAGTKYYFKYEKTYRTGLWTQVDLSPSLYLSESGVYTSVTTLNTPTFTNQIYVSWWIEPRYTRISLANMSYNSNDGSNTNYNSTYNVKLYISKTSANLFTGTQTSTLSVYSGSIYQTENLSDLNSNYCIALSSINLKNEINITYDRFSSATIWQTLYLGLEIQYDNYYSNVQTPPLSIKTRAYPPSLAKIHTNITRFSASINYRTGNAQISIIRTTANSSWWYQFLGPSPNGVPSLLPSNIYLVISSDSNTIKQSHNINFGAAAPSNILKHKGSDMYGVIDMISNDTLTADVPLTNKSVYAGDLYIAFLSIYPTPNIPGTLSYISDDDEIPDYRLESTAIPYNYTSALAGNHATSIPLTEPTTHSDVSVTRHADTTTDTLVWTFDSVNYAHGNYEVTDFKWGVNSNTIPQGFRRTANTGGLPVPGSNYRMSGLNPGTSYYIRLDVSYNDQGSFFKVISSNIISTSSPPPNQATISYYGRLNNGIYITISGDGNTAYYDVGSRSVISNQALYSNSHLLNTSIVKITAIVTNNVYRVNITEREDALVDYQYVIRISIGYTGKIPAIIPASISRDTSNTLNNVKTSHLTVNAAAITVNRGSGFSINLSVVDSYTWVPAEMLSHTYTFKFISVYVYTDAAMTILDSNIPKIPGSDGYQMKLTSSADSDSYSGPYTGSNLYLRFKLISDHPDPTAESYIFPQDHIVHKYPNAINLGPANPAAPTFGGNVNTNTLGALKFPYANFTANYHGGYTWSTNYVTYISASKRATGSRGNLTISGLTPNSNYNVEIYKEYNEFTDAENRRYSTTLSNLTTRDYVLPTVTITPRSSGWGSTNVTFKFKIEVGTRGDMDWGTYVSQYVWYPLHAIFKDPAICVTRTVRRGGGRGAGAETTTEYHYLPTSSMRDYTLMTVAGTRMIASYFGETSINKSTLRDYSESSDVDRIHIVCTHEHKYEDNTTYSFSQTLNLWDGTTWQNGMDSIIS
jgi:hypothetical protein